MSKDKRAGRSTLTFMCCLLAMPTCAALLPGVHAASIEVSLFAGAVLGVAYLLLRPILRLLTFPMGCLTLGLFGFVVDSGLILALSHLVDGFSVDHFGWALASALIVSALSAIVGGHK